MWRPVVRPSIQSDPITVSGKGLVMRREIVIFTVSELTGLKVRRCFVVQVSTSCCAEQFHYVSQVRYKPWPCY